MLYTRSPGLCEPGPLSYGKIVGDCPHLTAETPRTQRMRENGPDSALSAPLRWMQSAVRGSGRFVPSAHVCDIIAARCGEPRRRRTGGAGRDTSPAPALPGRCGPCENRHRSKVRLRCDGSVTVMAPQEAEHLVRYLAPLPRFAGRGGLLRPGCKNGAASIDFRANLHYTGGMPQ